MLADVSEAQLVYILQHPDTYKVILNGVKGGTQTKRLAAQFISRFFKHFPDQSEAAINALLDLCEDEDSSVSLKFYHSIYCFFQSFSPS